MGEQVPKHPHLVLNCLLRTFCTLSSGRYSGIFQWCQASNPGFSGHHWVKSHPPETCLKSRPSVLGTEAHEMARILRAPILWHELSGLKGKRLRATQKSDTPTTNEVGTWNESFSAYPELHFMESISFRDVLLLHTQGDWFKTPNSHKTKPQKHEKEERLHTNTNLPSLEQFQLIYSQPAHTRLAISVQFPRSVIPAQ